MSLLSLLQLVFVFEPFRCHATSSNEERGWMTSRPGPLYWLFRLLWAQFEGRWPKRMAFGEVDKNHLSCPWLPPTPNFQMLWYMANRWTFMFSSNSSQIFESGSEISLTRRNRNFCSVMFEKVPQPFQTCYRCNFLVGLTKMECIFVYLWDTSVSERLICASKHGLITLISL